MLPALPNIMSSFTCCKSIDAVRETSTPQSGILQNNGPLNNGSLQNILRFSGPLDTSTVMLVSKEMRGAINEMNQTMLDEISTVDMKLFKDIDKNIVRALTPEDRKEKARTTTSADLLKFFASDQFESVRRTVAGNPNTPDETLRHLAQDPSVLVHIVLAGNPNTPGETLSHLAQDPSIKLTQALSIEVRKVVAGNPNTPLETLSQLAQDLSIEVRKVVAGNPNTPRETLSQLAQEQQNLADGVRYKVAGNPNTPRETLRQLAQDPSAWVRGAVAGNPNTPRKTLSQLFLRLFLAS